MSTAFEMKLQASTLRKQNKFQEALELYSVLWADNREICDEWDGWGYAQSLRKVGRSQEALMVCREVHASKPDFEYNNNLYAWCIYDQAIAKVTDEQIEPNEPAFFEAANTIMALVMPGTYSPFARTLLRVVDYLKSRASYPANQILEWTGKITPDQLSTEVGRGGKDDHGKQREFASDREKWYAERCKALLEANEFQACIALADEALVSFSTFHYDNDVWFRWRRALAEAGLGDKETAVKEIQSLLSRKQDWFIYHRMAQFQYDMGQFDDAWSNAVDAALGPGDLEFKWELFLLMGLILRNQDHMDEARRHVLLAARIRQERDWKMPQELVQAIADLDVDMTSDTAAFDLQKDLRNQWRTAKLANLPRCSGKIVNILPNGRAGFITGDDGHDYYFKLSSFQGSRHGLTEGLMVEYRIEKNPNPDRRDNAIFVKTQQS